MAKYKEQILQANKIHKQAICFRGKIINHISAIDNEISQLLRDYFCSPCENKKRIFMKRMMGSQGLNLNKKILILFDILRDDYSPYWKKNKKSLKKIIKAIEFRNKLAHSVVDVSSEALRRPISDGIGFIQIEDGKPIDDERIEQLQVDLNDFSSILAEIRDLLPYKM